MKRLLSIALLPLVAATTARAQTFRTTDSTIRRIWRLGMDSSQLESLAQPFIDSIGQGRARPSGRVDNDPASTIFNHMVNYSGRPLDRVFHALSDPTRRAILGRLVRGPALVTELARPFPTSLAAVSKHLRVLEAAGLLTRRIEGREHHCALRPEPLKGAAEWIAFYQKFWESKLDALEAFLTNSPATTENTHARQPRRRRR